MARPVEKRRYGQQLPGASRLRGIRPTRGGDPASACRARGDSRPVREDAARHSSALRERGGGGRRAARAGGRVGTPTLGVGTTDRPGSGGNRASARGAGGGQPV